MAFSNWLALFGRGNLWTNFNKHRLHVWYDSGLFLSNMTLQNSDFINEEFSNTFTSIETSQTLNKFVHNF